MKADGNDYYYAHDHLYSPAALIDSSGTVLERYEYDAYGNCSILEPNFAPDPDGQSDYGNNYLFTGRRVDILDNGSLKIQYNRNRYYDYYTGRWLTHDPLGIAPAGGEKNQFGPEKELTYGLNLYEYALSSPTNVLDPTGTIPIWLEKWAKKYGYIAWRTFMVRAPHWRVVMDQWYWEIPPDSMTYTGIGDPRNMDIARNAGFQKLLRCWIARKYCGTRVPTSMFWWVRDSGFFWRYYYGFGNTAGGWAAYNSTTHFLGSYTAGLTEVARADCKIDIRVRIDNISGWTSATRLPNFAKKRLGGLISVFQDHPRGGARYSPSTGGDFPQTYLFVLRREPIENVCILP